MTVYSEKDLGRGQDYVFCFEPSQLRQRLVGWFQEHQRPLPWRQLWQRYRNPYHIWVSEIMLQQTVIKAVIPVYTRFLERFPDPWALANAPEQEVASAVRGLGYYRRFRYLQRAAQALVAQAQGGKLCWPEEFAAWKQLAGVGDYTAAAISSIAFQRPHVVVDGNVERVFCRLLDIRLPSNLPLLKKYFQIIGNRLLDPQAPGDFNQALMEIGQTFCRVEAPDCALCPLAEFCLAKRHGSFAEAPAAKVKKATQDVALRLTIVQKGGQIALLQRPSSARFLKGTAGFITDVKDARRYIFDGGMRAFPHLKAATSLGAFKHQITHHRLAVEVYCLRLKASVGGDKPRLGRGDTFSLEWLPVEQVEERLVANLDRKAWRIFEQQSSF